MSRRVFTREFKVAAVKEVDSGKPLGHVARRLEISPNTLHRWRREFSKHPTKAFSGHGKRMLAESREAELERKVGQMTIGDRLLKNLCGLSRSNRKPKVATHDLQQGPRRSGNSKQPVQSR